jgi:hypothetical protein
MKRILLGLISISLTACDEKEPPLIARFSLYANSDGVTIFESEPLKHVIVDSYGGLVLPMSIQDQKKIREATAGPDYSKQDVTFFACGKSLYTLSLYPDNETEFFYLRGNFKETIDILERSGVNVISVNEVPTSSDGVKEVLANQRR